MSTTEITSPECPAIHEHFPPRLSGRIPSLDGLRAVAIALVLIGHLPGGQYRLPLVGIGHIPERFRVGILGVRLFFVISGLLITTLLLRERERRGHISLRAFYVRRALRILPASYTFLLFLVLVAAFGMLAIPRMSLLSSFLYFRNYYPYSGEGNWYTAHLWSLSVEEQFYLIWPAILVLLGKRGALVVALLSLPIADVTRMFQNDQNWARFEMNMDALACGCILACTWRQLGQNERWQRFLQSPLFWAIPITVLASSKLSFLGGAWLAFGTGITNILIAVSVERFVRYYRGGAASFLNSRVAVFAGTLSYSLYLWQQPWIHFDGSPLQTFPLNVTVACACAALSYYSVERPFLRLRDRWRTT